MGNKAGKFKRDLLKHPGTNVNVSTTLAGKRVIVVALDITRKNGNLQPAAVQIFVNVSIIKIHFLRA